MREPSRGSPIFGHGPGAELTGGHVPVRLAIAARPGPELPLQASVRPNSHPSGGVRQFIEFGLVHIPIEGEHRPCLDD